MGIFNLFKKKKKKGGVTITIGDTATSYDSSTKTRTDYYVDTSGKTVAVPQSTNINPNPPPEPTPPSPKPKSNKGGRGGGSSLPGVPETPDLQFINKDNIIIPPARKDTRVIPTIRRGVDNLERFGLNTFASITSSQSPLRLRQEIIRRSAQLNKDSSSYEKDVTQFGKTYGGRELEESEYNKARLEQTRLENKYQRLQKEQAEIEKKSKKLEDKELEMGISPIAFARSDLGRPKEWQEQWDVDYIAQGLYGVTSIPKSLLFPGKREKTTIREDIKNIIRTSPTLVVLAGAGKGVKTTKDVFLKPNKIELLAAPKPTNVALTKLETKLIDQGQLTKANIKLVGVVEPKIVKITSRVDRFLQRIENSRAKVLNIEPKVYGEIVSGKPKVSGSISRDIYFLNGRQINSADFLSKTRGQSARANRLSGGMSQEIRAGILDKANKDVKELASSIAESRFGVPNYKAFPKDRIINLGYQESKEIARVTNPRKVTGMFGDIKVSQRRPVVKPTPSGKTITRTNIAGILDEIKSMNKDINLYRETFVGKDVTYPNIKTPPFKVEGLIIEKKIPLSSNRDYVWIKGSGKSSQSYLGSLYSKQIINNLQNIKADLISKNIKSTRPSRLPKSELISAQARYGKPSQSLYYGQGLYERTEESLTTNINRPVLSITKRATLNNNSFTYLSNTRLLEAPIIKSLSRERTKNVSRSLNKEVPREIVKEITKQQPKLQEKLVTRQVTRQIEKGLQKITARITKIGKFTKPSPFYLPQSKRLGGSLFGSEAGYKAYIKRGGQTREVPGIFSKGEALRVGERTALSSLAATFGIKKTGFKVKSKSPSYKVNTKLFRSFKIKKGKPIALTNEYIQRRGQRLSNLLEVAEIQRARRLR